MTKYTEDLCVGGVASSNDYWSDWTPDKAFDDNIDTGYHNPGTPSILQYQFTAPRKIEKYTIQSRIGFPSESPTAWTLQASTNGTDWVDVDSRTGLTWVNTEKKEFTFTNSSYYLYYRIYVPISYRTIMEMEMMEAKTPTLLSEIYDVTLKRGNRGANKLGWIRPTVGEFFMTNKDFRKILNFTPTIWDRSTAGPNVTIIDDYTVEGINRDGCRTVMGLTSGKFYVEISVITLGWLNIGLCQPGISHNGTLLYASSQLPVWDTDYNKIYNENNTYIVTPNSENGMIVGMAINIDDKEVEFFKNGTSLGTAYWETDYAVHVAMGGRNSAPMLIRANFGQSEFIYQIPNYYLPYFG